MEQAEFEKVSSEEEEEIVKDSEVDDSQNLNSQNSQETNQEGDEADDSLNECGSDEEDMESGHFLEYIKKITEKATKERRYLIKELKCKERRGCIFFDRINRVVAALQREKGKYDYLIEWKYCN